MTRSLRCFLLVALLVVVGALAAPKKNRQFLPWPFLEQKESRAEEKCIQGDNCKLPDCMCASIEPPGGLSLDKVPQFVILSYDDAVTVSNEPFYMGFKDMTNPNNCRITMTFFLSHLYTDYTIVNELHRLGHEISLHSVTHKSDISDYWRPANVSVWKQEMEDLRKMIVKNAFIPETDLKGWRAPFLEMGGDDMYTAIQELGLQYDCSWTTQRFTNWFDGTTSALWPYTLDFPSPQDCPLGKCPTGEKSYPGLWVMPMLDLNDNKNQPCAMLDTCHSAGTELLDNALAVEAFLKRNFNINYMYNKAPFGLYAHHSWFYEGELNNTQARQEGYTNFLMWLSNLDDVYVVSLDRVLAWMKDPKPIDEMNDISEIACLPFDPDSTCPSKENYHFTQEHNIPPGLTEVYMQTCSKPQPPYFPWLYNPYGLEDLPIES